MFSYLKRLFKRKQEDNAMKMKKYDIVKISEGNPKPVEETGVSAMNVEQLKQMYAMVGERIIEIKREYDGDVIQNSQTNPEYTCQPDNIPHEVMIKSNVPVKDVDPVQVQNNVQKQQIDTPKTKQCSSKARFYTIGNVEIKEDNGVIYQKQWIPVDSSDMSNYRIVSDVNNKIIPLKNKHIEVKKWVMVQTDDNDTCSEGNDGRTLING